MWRLLCSSMVGGSWPRQPGAGLAPRRAGSAAATRALGEGGSTASMQQGLHAPPAQPALVQLVPVCHADREEALLRAISAWHVRRARLWQARALRGWRRRMHACRLMRFACKRRRAALLLRCLGAWHDLSLNAQVCGAMRGGARDGPYPVDISTAVILSLFRSAELVHGAWWILADSTS